VISPERLAALPSLAALPAEARARLAEKFQETAHPDGQCIVAEGDRAESLYFVAEGRVEIRKLIDRTSGEQKVLSVLEPGDFFGEMALLEDAPRWASAVAQGPVTLLSLSAGEIRDWLAGDARVPLRFCLPFVGTLNARLRQTAREMMLLFDVGRLLAQNLDSAELARGLLQVLTRGLDEPVLAGFLLWRDYSLEYEMVAKEGPWPGGPWPASDPLLGWMSARGECFLSSAWETDERVSAPARAAWPAMRSLLAAPVLGERRPAGFFLFGHASKENFFTPTQRRVLAGVANLVGPAFEGAARRLEKQAEDRLRQSRRDARL
jgi:CRP-like cAMP-binding protein